LSFYNMAQSHNNTGIISQFITDDKSFFVEASLLKEEILKVKK
jgi:hypothetical protein